MNKNNLAPYAVAVSLQFSRLCTFVICLFVPNACATKDRTDTWSTPISPTVWLLLPIHTHRAELRTSMIGPVYPCLAKTQLILFSGGLHVCDSTAKSIVTMREGANSGRLLTPRHKVCREGSDRRKIRNWIVVLKTCAMNRRINALPTSFLLLCVQHLKPQKKR